MISVICPIYNEHRYIARCIDSILLQNYPQNDIELLLIDGMSTDGTREVIKKYQSDSSHIRLIDNEKKRVPPALNIGIKAARGKYILRIDAHSEYPANYISELIKYHRTLNADNVGGICQTLPVDDSLKSRAIALALSSRFGMGNSYFRVGSREVRKVDTVPFGCYTKDLFDRIGLYDEEMLCNEDDEFNGRIIKLGGSIYLIPHIVIKYYARDTITKLKKMFYQYGLFKPLVNKKIGSPTTIRQFFPILFLLELVVGIPLSLINQYLAIVYVSVVLLYLILALYMSMKEIKKWKDWKLVYLLPIVFFVIHTSYGWGYLRGLFKILMRQSFSVKVNR